MLCSLLLGSSGGSGSLCLISLDLVQPLLSLNIVEVNEA